MPTEVLRNLKWGDKKKFPSHHEAGGLFLCCGYKILLRNWKKSANFADFSYLAIKLAQQQKFCLSTPRQYPKLSLQSKTFWPNILRIVLRYWYIYF